ncbi:DUF423 domain-containing protein [Arcticibacter tournemirensis]|uniref:DUF423 domain-containing protein n=1 Tax=Arcticibacter tournemirensis TaxID=699437 RepID=A0A4Q0M744_9SPHI|nr:DUF423 domain-containing protein [Arcticibacter tournemirensis]RXF68887.1 DUF423 domain-containing protein [Arcticibacter tournemirensis]
MNRKIIITASVFGIAAVILGAFGAHGLKPRISASDLENWKTAVSYHFYHTLALLFLSTVAKYRDGFINIAYYAFVLGIFLFSGSLYLLSTRAVTGLSAGFLGPITPIGGLMFIVGWLFLLLAAVKNK